MDAVTTVNVNGREYRVAMFDPMTAFDFFMDLENAKSNGKPYSHLAKKALNQCRTHDMAKELSNEAVFQEHFSKFPEDMLALMKEAMEALCRPFTKSQGDTGKPGNR